MGLIEHRFEGNHHDEHRSRPELGARIAIWPLGFGLACCAIEMMAASASAVRHRAVRGPDDSRLPRERM